MSEDKFEIASRQKLRFETSNKGLISAEDLWELPLTSEIAGKTSLDSIALSIHKQLRTTSDVASFVDEKAKADPSIQLRFDIVKHIIDTKKRENATKLEAKKRAETAQFLMSILERKQTNALENLTEEEIRKKLAELSQ